jgi:hypothetical protein
VEDIRAIAESEFTTIAWTSLQSSLKISKLFVAYLEDLVAVVQ